MIELDYNAGTIYSNVAAHDDDDDEHAEFMGALADAILAGEEHHLDCHIGLEPLNVYGPLPLALTSIERLFGFRRELLQTPASTH